MLLEEKLVSWSKYPQRNEEVVVAMKRVSISSTLLLAAVAGVGFFLFGRKILFFGTTRSSSSWRFDEDVPSSTNSTIAQQLNSQITPTAQSAQTMTDPMQDGPKQNEKMVKEEHALGPNDSAPVVHSHVAENTALCRQGESRQQRNYYIWNLVF